MEALCQAKIVPGSISTSKANYSAGAGPNRIIVVCVSDETNNGSRTVTGITWGGQALDVAYVFSGGTGNNDTRGEIWYLTEAKINAAPAYCNTFTVNWSAAATTETFTAFTLKNVDQAVIETDNDGSAPGAASLTVALPATTVDVNDMLVYITVNQSAATHTAPTSYFEISDQTVGASATAVAYRQITTAGTDNPTATWSVSDRLLITGVSFNGVADTYGTTYYSIGSGAWNSNTVWSLTSGGAAVAVGVWPRRYDHVVIASGHNITVDATNDNKSCGITPLALGQNNVGNFAGSGTTTFYHAGNITVNSGGTLTATVPVMLAGDTYIAGNFPVTGDLTNIGTLEVASTGNMDITGNLNLSGYSVTTLNNVGTTTATVRDDLNLDYTNAQLCGTGQLNLGNGGASPAVVRTNGALMSQICSGFTISCTTNCAGFPITGAGTFTGNTGPGGVGKSDGTSTLELWFDSRDFNADGSNPAVGTSVVTWSDKSGNNIDVTRNTTGVATYTAAGVTFNNVGYMSASDATLPMGTNPRTVFVCASSPSTDADDVLFTYGDSPFDDQSFGILKIQNDDGTVANRDGVRSFFYGNDFNVPGGFTPVGTMKVISASYQPNIQTVHVNGTSSTTTPGTPNTVSGGADGLNIGGWTSWNLYSQATIAEVIFFSAVVNSAQLIIINNYLSAKNSFTLAANDIYTQDISANGDYDYEMIGIGKATDGSEHTDAQGTGILRIFTVNSSATLDVGEYLMTGHDNGSLVTTGKTPPQVDGTVIKERMLRTWRVTEVGDVGGVSVRFNISAYPGTPLAQNLRLLIDRDGDGFGDNDVTPIGGATLLNDLVTFSNVNFQSGDRFTLGNTSLAQPLPIQLLSFNAKVEKSIVKLDWVTATEMNNDFFTVERSKDGRQWEEILEVDGSGTTHNKMSYQTVDDGPLKGYSYYRLKQTDFDQNYSYSSAVGVYLEYKQITVHPNPSNGIFYLNAPFEADAEDIRIVGISGQEMKAQIFREGDRFVIDGSQLTTGIYMLRVFDGLIYQHVKFIRN